MKTYSSRTNARRAARAACRRALKAPEFQAYEGHDYGIHPQGPTADDLLAGRYRTRYSFELRGPAKDANKEG